MQDNAIGYIQEGTNTININITTEQQRLTKFSYRDNMLKDNFYGQVVEELGNVVSSASETGLIKQIDDTNNIFRLVMEEISKVYDKNPERFFDTNDEINADMISVYKDLKINNHLASANLKSNAFNNVLLQIGVNKDKKFTFRARTANTTIVVADDFNELQEVYIYGGKNNDTKMEIWHCYNTKESYDIEVASADEVLKHNKKDIKGEIAPSELGFLPFIRIDNTSINDEVGYWNMYKGDNLVKATIQIAIKMTFLNQLIKFQSFKQLVATSDNGNLKNLDGVTLDPSSIIYLFGENSKITTLDLESNYKMLWDTTKEIIANISGQYKINPSTFKTTNVASSGYALQMENFKLDAFIGKQQEYFVGVEEELFKMLSDIDGKLDLGIIKGNNFNIIFQPPQYPKTVLEQLDKLQKQVDMGLVNIVDEIVKNENVTTEEALIIYEENLKSRNKLYEKTTIEEPKIDVKLEV